MNYCIHLGDYRLNVSQNKRILKTFKKCDICFMKSLDLHFTCLRSLFSLIDCWLISSQVSSLMPLDPQNLSIPNPSRSQVHLSHSLHSFRGSRSLRPRAWKLRIVRILRPRGRILRMVKFWYIYHGWPVKLSLTSSFSPPAPPLSSSTPLHLP